MIKQYTKIIKKARKFTIKKRVLIALLTPPIVLALAFLLLYFFWLKDLPNPANVQSTTGSYSTQIYDRHNKLLYTLYSDRNQTFVPLDKIPNSLQQATIAIEDRDFYRHGAVDFRGIARALYANLFHQQFQGGSTLTQQLVKNSLLTPERTIQRKIKEVVLSFAVEILYNKDQILEMYLNQVPYGGTAYGVEAASQTYFGKKVGELTLAQQAFIAGLPEAPSILSPYGSHPERGKKRQEEVLRKMAEQGYITNEQRDNAIKEQLIFQKIANPIKAPHFVFYVKQLLVEKYGEQVVEQGGLSVITSLDLTVQEYAEATVAAEIAKVERFRVGNGAALITKPGTGEILAMVGSKNYFGNPEPEGCISGQTCTFEPNVNVTLAYRQPGSSIKPINYAVGLIKGYTAATPFIDAAICFPNPPQPAYCPKNYDGKFHGIVQMREALGNSFNIPAVEMLKMNGLDAMIATASAMGITTFKDPSQYGLGLTLGGGEVFMTDMATAFGVFANQGYRIDLHPILKVTDKNGEVLEEYIPPKSPIFGKKVIPSEVAFIISDILADNKARFAAFGSNSELVIPRQHVSVKTGTTNDYRDNWTIGYTPSYLVAVWVGNNDNSEMSGIASGVTGAAPIWNALMSHVLEGKKPEIPQKPPNVFGQYVCTTIVTDGEGQNCPTRFEYIIEGTKTKTYGTIKQEAVWVDKTTGAQATPGQSENVEAKEHSVLTDSFGNSYCMSCAHPEANPSPTPTQ
ncbi:MAG TPA: transglycosylase domain-containing protein [Patescibacteria group bacterium]|nr:transglycosylase domain-containing protein [Patescibacteria group bacterium]